MAFHSLVFLLLTLSSPSPMGLHGFTDIQGWRLALWLFFTCFPHGVSFDYSFTRNLFHCGCPCCQNFRQHAHPTLSPTITTTSFCSVSLPLHAGACSLPCLPLGTLLTPIPRDPPSLTDPPSCYPLGCLSSIQMPFPPFPSLLPSLTTIPLVWSPFPSQSIL